MTDLRVIGADGSLLDTVLELLPADPGLLASSVVVFDGKRPGHFLRRALARRIGRAYVPPRVHTFSTFVDMLYAGDLAGTGEELQPLDAVGLLASLHRQASPRLGGERYTSLEAFLPLGQRLFSALEELRAEGATPAQVRAASTGLQFVNGEMLATLFERFYERILQTGKTTPALRLAACAFRRNELLPGEYARVILAGIAPSSRDAVTLVRHLVTLPRITCLVEAGPGALDLLRALGGSWGDMPSPAAMPPVHLYRAGDTHGQVAGLARMIGELRERGVPLDEDTVIVVPSPDALFPLVHWVLPEVPEHNISLGYPVVRTPVFGFLAGVWNVLSSMRGGEVGAGDYLRCMLHPYIKSIRWNTATDATRIMFHTIEDFLVRDKGWTRFRLDDLEQERELCVRIAAASAGAEVPFTPEEAVRHLRSIHDATLRSVLAARTLGDAALRCIDMLAYVAAEGTAGRHQMFRQFAVAIIDRLDKIRSSSLGASVVTSSTAFGTLLRQLVEDVVVPFHGTPLKGLQVLGWLETRNLRFKRVCILDVNEDILPGGDAVDPLLPPQVRTALGLRGRREQELAAEQQFAALLGGAEEVHLFFREGGGKVPSRFIEKILWERERTSGDLSAAAAIRPVTPRAALRQVAPTAVAKSAEVSAALSRLPFSATMLDAYLRCPLRFFYAHVLGLAERDDAEEEIDRAEIGTFVHGVLAEYHRAQCDAPLEVASVDPVRLTGIIVRRFEQAYGADARGQRLLIRMQVEKHLARYLTDWRLPLIHQSPVRVRHVEHRMRCELRGVTLVGTADHIEQRGETTYIMDYKTGADESKFRIRFDAITGGDRESWAKAIGSLQLPLYAMLYRAESGATYRELAPVYVMLGKERMGASVELPLFDAGDDIGAVMQDLEDVVTGLVGEIRDPGVPFAATADLKKQCPQCAFREMCGTRWVRGWQGIL